jgi:glycosyltransferase involved in cell wall biosynthesis
MKNDILVSVVIPCYNSEAWLATAIESVLAQVYSALEIIVIDDGSTDNTVNVAQATLHAGRVPWYLVRQANDGPSRARNVGWRKARGQWIQFLDADDVIDSEKVAIQMAVALQAPAEVAVIYSTWQAQTYGEHGWQADHLPVTPRITALAACDLLHSENFLATGSQLFRRDWLERVGGYDETRHLIEDNQLMLRLALSGGEFWFASCERPLFFYRRRAAGSLSQRNAREFIEGCVLNAHMVEDHYRTNSILTTDVITAISAVYFQAGRYFAEHDTAAFERMVRHLDTLQPPHFLPPGPAQLRLLSRLVGYRRAERVAVYYRYAKQYVRALT